MEQVLIIISAVAAIAFWVGLFKPSWVGMPNRKKSALVYVLICLVANLFKGYLYPKQQTAEEVAATKERAVKVAEEEKSFKFSTVTLAQYQSKPVDERKKIITNYLASEDITDSAFTGFYNCMSEYTATKSEGLQVGLVIKWCADDYKKDPKSLDSRVNFDAFNSNFSGWDGSYRPLEKLIKENMNDDDSYKHVKTTYRVLMKGTPHAIVTTTFRGSNALGGIVKQEVVADVDIKTGEIINIIDPQ